MHKLLYIALVLWLAQGWAPGQNLVLNPSFEEVLFCPESRIKTGFYATPWRGSVKIPIFQGPPTNSEYYFGDLDLFHTCADPGLGAPLSDIGYEFPHFGESYGGFKITRYTYLYTPFPDQKPYIPREWAQGGLSEPLEAGVRYNFSVWVSLGDRFGVNVWQLGLRFSDQWFYRQSYLDSLLPPLYWENDSGAYIQQSCDEWVQLSGTFVAQGGEQYFMFGSSVNSPSLFLDSIHKPLTECYNRYDSIYRAETNGAYLGPDTISIHIFIDDFAIWREDKQLHVAEAGKGGTLCLGQQESITLGSPAREQYHYFWLNMQGDTLGNTSQLTVSPTQTTTYILSQWDFKFDQTWDTVTVFVEPNCPELWLPTWFAPTQSQYWQPQWRDIEYWEVTVYNSLGQVVHRYTGTPELHPGWDGYSMATGVYCAVVNARAYNGEQLRAVEKVMVLR